MQKPKSPIFIKARKLDKNIQNWLYSTGSLTQKIENLSGQKMLVKPIFEGRQTLTLSQKKWLKIPKNRPQSAWVREVLLFGKADEPAWVLAKSIFAFDGLTGQARQLSNLGCRPIGYVIFRRNKAKLIQRYYQAHQNGWERTSLYDWQGTKILISELFLPTFLQYLQKKYQD